MEQITMIAEPTVANILRAGCPSQSVLDIVGSKWSVLILYALRDGTRRYSELQHSIGGISQKMLTQTLRELERNGLISRTVHAVVPPRTEYTLTPLGASLEQIVYDLGRWAEGHIDAVLQARSAYDTRDP